MYRWIAVCCVAVACSGRAPVANEGVRVVSLHDVTTELIVALGAVDRLVGLHEPVDVEPDVTTAVARVPRVGDLESIRAVRPTIVVGLQIVARKEPELVARLREAGIEVFLVDPTRLDDVFATVRSVGTRVDAGAAAEQLAARLAGEAAALAPVKGERAVRVFVYDCCDPPFTAGRKTVLGDLIARAGGENVFGDVDAAWTHVSWEQVVARRPELVVIDAYAYAGQGDVAEKQRAVQAISALAGLPTVTMPLRNALGGIHSIAGLRTLRTAIRGAL